MQKACSNCSQMAEYSLVFVLSSVGSSPRLQKCSSAVSFCGDCLRELCECFCTDQLRSAVNSAYTELNQRVRGCSIRANGSGS